MATFDYASDIAPMKSSYFSDLSSSRLSDREKSYLSQKYVAEVSPFLKAQNDTLSALSKSATEQLSFQRAMTDYQSESLKLQQERDAANKMGEFTSMLDEKFDSGAKPTDLLIDITKLQAKNPLLFKTAIGAATLDAYKARASALASDEREAKSMNYNLVQQLTPYDPQMANDLASGIVSPDAARLKLVDYANKKAAEESKSKAEAERAEVGLNIQLDFIKDMRSQYNAPDYIGQAQADIGNSQLASEVAKKSGRPIPNTAPIAPLPQSGALFKPTQRNVYVRNLAMLTGKDQKEIESQYQNDLDLYKALGSKLDEQETVIYRRSAGVPYGTPVPYQTSTPLPEQDKIFSGFKVNTPK
jgi:hypothetical protein